MNVKLSQYMELMYKVGVVCDEKGKDTQKIVRPRVQHMDQSSLNVPEDTNWAHCFHPSAPQIFGNNGKKFEDGESGIGETPNWFLQGTYVMTTKSTSSGQETIMVGAIPTMGKEEGGGGGGQ